MTINFDPGQKPSEGPFTVDETDEMDVLDIADGLFRSYAADLARLRDKIRLGETDELKESGKLEERGKVDKLRKDAAGQVGAGALDLGAARDEVGRRLACLRRAG